MFTGIIREVGTLVNRQRKGGIIRLTLQAPKTAAKISPMESVAVNGVCLSAVTVGNGKITVEMIQETQRLTTLGDLKVGHRVNLEPSLSLMDRLNGHVVLGHVDGVAVVTKRQQRPGERILEIRMDRSLRKFMVPKGPITLDGVSLTLGQKLSPTHCRVHLIPETLRRTTLDGCVVGAKLNVEIDYLAKLIRQFHGKT